MVKFVVYLLETGVCLTFLFLAYWLFLRKETYFNFIRLFLVGSIFLALIVPLIHLNFIIPQGSLLKNPAVSIVKFRSYYEEMVRLIDADFGSEPGFRHASGQNFAPEMILEEGGIIPDLRSHGLSGFQDRGGENKGIISRSGISIMKIIIIIYIAGVFYFFARFIYLVIRLYLLVKRYGIHRQDGFRMVEIKEQISPFSFFRYLFINPGSFNDSELQNVLEHEKAHIRQQHSIDHLLAHGLAVFQWFNPFAWQLRGALKTTHEYIADYQVINQGYEAIDYQSLLLRQVMGYHSVELVNNFNLKPIKKRIAMMSKKRSGIPARLKASLVIPFALAIFLLFADFTLKGTSKSRLTPAPDIEGLWVKQSKDEFSKTLLIQNNRFTLAEGTELREYFLRFDQDLLILAEREGAPGVQLKYETRGQELTIWWNDSKGSSYLKSEKANTLDHLLGKQELNFDLPHISQYRLMDETMLYRICYGMDPRGGTALTFNGKSFNLNDLNELIEKEKGKLSKLDQGSMTALFLIDKSIPMILVDQVRQELRKANALHVAEGGYPHGEINLSPLLYHSVGLPRLLPPMNAKILDKNEVEKGGGKIYTINLSARNTTPKDVDMGLQQFIGTNKGGKYVISLEYDNDIPYGQYVESVDMVYKVVYKFRKELALKKYKAPYEQLGEDLQREIRKAYPMALSESWSDR